MKPEVEQAVADAIPHERMCPQAYAPRSSLRRCTCRANARRATLMSKLELHMTSTRDGYVYLR